MLGSPILDLAIGMAFIYLLLSLIASVIQEGLATITQARAANLERALHSLFSGDAVQYDSGGTYQATLSFVEAVYKHGLVSGLYQDPGHDSAKFLQPSRWLGRISRFILRIKRPTTKVGVPPDSKPDDIHTYNLGDNFLLPSYIPSRTFALALTNLLDDSTQQGISLDSIRTKLNTLQNQSKRAQAYALEHLIDDLLKQAQAFKETGIVSGLNDLAASVAKELPPAVTGQAQDSDPPPQVPVLDSVLTKIAAILATGFSDLSEKASSKALKKHLDQASARAKSRPGENMAVEALLALLDDADNAENKVEKFKTNVEGWYNAVMDRASGWYKRYVQRILLFVGLAIAIGFNVDSVRVARTLWFDHDARQGLASAASEYVKNHSAPQTPGEKIEPAAFESQLSNTVKSFNDVSQASMLPVGWRHKFPGDYWNDFWHEAVGNHNGALWRQLILALIGWCITAGALSLGAPFWFDTLNKFMVVRGTVKPDEKSPNEPSKS